MISNSYRGEGGDFRHQIYSKVGGLPPVLLCVTVGGYSIRVEMSARDISVSWPEVT
jgi:hypothetical protein